MSNKILFFAHAIAFEMSRSASQHGSKVAAGPNHRLHEALSSLTHSYFERIIFPANPDDIIDDRNINIINRVEHKRVIANLLFINTGL